MEEFPFSAEDWEELQEAARPVVNATLAEDPVLRASHFEGFRITLAGLRARYGDHPILLETEADFTEDTATRVELYQRAKDIAVEAGLPTASIRLALARVLLEELGQPERAREELLACQGEMEEWADKSERRQWSELMKEANSLSGRCP